MKKSIFFSVMLLISSIAFAQTKFTVPELTDVQKLQTARTLGNNNIIAAINFAKSQGLTAAEYGEYEGKLFPWNKEDGFEGWINGFLYMNVAVARNVEIMEQSENKILVRVSDIYPEFEQRGKMLGVTYEVFLKWYEIMFIEIFNNLDCHYSQVNIDEGMKITIEKK